MASNKIIASSLVHALVLVTIPGNKLVEHFYLADIFLLLFFHAVRHELKERNDYFL